MMSIGIAKICSFSMKSYKEGICFPQMSSKNLENCIISKFTVNWSFFMLCE